MPHKAFITNTQTQLLSKICLSCGLPISLEQDKQGKKRVRIFGFAILDYKGKFGRMGNLLPMRMIGV